jgi:hypothetical protein
LFGERTDLAFGAGVVDGDVDTTEALDGFVDEIADVLLLADIRLHEFGFSIEFAQFSRECLALYFPPPGDDEARAFSCECERRGTADTRQGAGN